MSKSKKCSRCKEDKSLVEFHKEPRRPDGLRLYCKACNNSSCRKYRERNKEKLKVYNRKTKDDKRNKRLLQRYGIDTNTYNKMLKQQKGVCKVCRNPETRIEYRTGITARLAVDHCHKTGKVRGLLCNQCNVVLGLVDDSTSRLLDLISYVVDSNE